MDNNVNRCTCCNAVDNTGLINLMCTDCYDLSLDVGKGFTKKQKRELEKRRSENGYTGGR